MSLYTTHHITSHIYIYIYIYREFSHKLISMIQPVATKVLMRLKERNIYIYIHLSIYIQYGDIWL